MAKAVKLQSCGVWCCSLDYCWWGPRSLRLIPWEVTCFAGVWLLLTGLFSAVESGTRSGCARCPLRKAVGSCGAACGWRHLVLRNLILGSDTLHPPWLLCTPGTLQACSHCPLLLAPGLKADPCHYKSKHAGCWGAPSPGERQHRTDGSFAFDSGRVCVFLGWTEVSPVNI